MNSRISLFNYLKFVKNNNKATMLSLFGRSFTIFAGAITTILVILFFSSTTQGYFYTYSSLISLQIIIEYSIGSIFIHIVGFDGSNIRIDNNRLIGAANQKNSLKKIINYFNLRIYLISFSFFLTLVILGHITFQNDSTKTCFRVFTFPIC